MITPRRVPGAGFARLPSDLVRSENPRQRPAGVIVDIGGETQFGAGLEHDELVIVDGHEVIRLGVRTLLENEAALEVVGEVG